jgi:hypothetical protein
VLYRGTIRQADKDRLQLEIIVTAANGKRIQRLELTQDSGATTMARAGRLDDKATLFVATTCTHK